MWTCGPAIDVMQQDSRILGGWGFWGLRSGDYASGFEGRVGHLGLANMVEQFHTKSLQTRRTLDFMLFAGFWALIPAQCQVRVRPREQHSGATDPRWDCVRLAALTSGHTFNSICLVVSGSRT